MKTKTRSLVLMAFFAALVAVCSQIIIPLPYVPINLALFAVYLAGSLLGAKYGGISMLIFLALGFVGAPVFAGMQGGVGILFGKTGGYIIGYVFCAVLVGFLCKKKENSFWFLCLAFVAGLFVCYVFGTAWFMVVTKMDLIKSLTFCVFPFLPGDAVKILLAAFLTLKLKPKLNLAN